MSERYKLQKDWELRAILGHELLTKDMLLEMAKLVEQCPHNKTHWIQEMTREGILTDKLFKRCYLCGYNIDEMEAPQPFVDLILAEFDSQCEREKERQTLAKKESVNPKSQLSKDNLSNRELDNKQE
jgi:hypothetical protein